MNVLRQGLYKMEQAQSSHCGSPVMNPQLGSMRTRVQSLAPLNGLRIQHYRELWSKLQTWLGSRIAVAVAQAGSCSSDLTPSLETSICCRYDPKKTKKKKKKIVPSPLIEYSTYAGHCNIITLSFNPQSPMREQRLFPPFHRCRK